MNASGVKLRDLSEIQRAHDILHFLGTSGAPAVFDDPVAVHVAHDVLAWVLGFACGESFAENLAGAIEFIRAAGFVERDAGELITDEEARKRGLL